MADHANAIAIQVQKGRIDDREQYIASMDKIKTMGNLVTDMLVNALRAYEDSNLANVETVIAQDESIKELQQAILANIKNILRHFEAKTMKTGMR